LQRLSLHGTFFNGFSVLNASRHSLLRRRPLRSSAIPQDETSVGITTAACVGSSADDRSTAPFL
jgi:hypothetical protein